MAYLPPQPSIIPGGDVVGASQDAEVQPLMAEESHSREGGKITALPFAESEHGEISRLVEQVKDTGPPPDRPPSEDDLYEWLNRLADWVDKASSLPDKIERVGRRVSKSPSARFVQALDDANASIQGTLNGLDSQPTMPNEDLLAGAVDELWNLIMLLVRLLMEP